mmetsp:Transcript_742/g.1760  ORF Transcript_742/g.1760 Transcript_742/m.1760 type:complete len:339 (-) Transcript_742:207-1223(-)
MLKAQLCFSSGNRSLSVNDDSFRTVALVYRPLRRPNVTSFPIHHSGISGTFICSAGDRNCPTLDSDFEDTLNALLSCNTAELSELAGENQRILSMEFLLWLEERSRNAELEDKTGIETLAGQLVALKEGLQPINREELMAVDMPAQTKSRELSGLSSEELAVEVRRSASAALTPEGARVFDEKAAELREGMRAAKTESARQLMGRQPLPTLEEARRAEQAAAAADASGRILSVLLEMPTREERRAALPDAFTPPQPTGRGGEARGEEGGPGDEDLVYTTPFSLVAAIDMELARFNGRVGQLSASTLLPGRARTEEGERALRELREDVFSFLDGNVLGR